MENLEYIRKLSLDTEYLSPEVKMSQPYDTDSRTPGHLKLMSFASCSSLVLSPCLLILCLLS